jgi:hypothetical protein
MGYTALERAPKLAGERRGRSWLEPSQLNTEEQVAWRIARRRTDAKGMQQTAQVKLLTASRLRVWGARTVLSLLDQGLTAGASFVANSLLARWLAPRLCGALAFAGFLLVTGIHNVIFLQPMTVYGACRYREEVSKYFADPFSLQPLVFPVWTLHVTEDMPKSTTRVLVLHCDDYRAQQSPGISPVTLRLIEDYRLDDPSLPYRSLVRLVGILGWMIPKRLRCYTMVFGLEPRV